MIVFAGGMQRSGSTFSFNVIREILNKRGSTHQEANTDLSGVILRSGNSQNIIMKGHSANEITIRLIQSGSVKSICTIRKPEDAIASWMKIFKFDLDTSINQMIEWLEMHANIKQHSLNINYDDIDKRPLIVSAIIMKYLVGRVNVLESYRISRKYSKLNVKTMSSLICSDSDSVEDLGFSFHDKNTFFHRNHVASIPSMAAKHRLKGKEILIIREALNKFIDINGNLLG